MALCGGWLERVITRWSRYCHPQRAWVYRTTRGKAIRALAPQREPEMVWLWRLLGLVLLLTAWLIYRIGQLLEVTKGRASAGGVGTQVLIWLGFSFACFTIARRRSAQSADHALQSDTRPPVLYLRSFRADGLAPSGKTWHEYQHLEGWSKLKNLEQVLTSMLQQFGPVVAIGKPGEELPELGAARMYVSNDDWRDVVVDLAARSQAVILQAGETQGLRWEMQMAGQSLHPEQVLLFVPFALQKKKASERERSYQLFHQWAQECIPGPLPITMGGGCFVYFVGPDWEGHVLSAKQSIAPDHTLKPILQQLAQDHRFPKEDLGRQSIGPAVSLVVIICSLLMIGASLLILSGCPNTKASKMSLRTGQSQQGGHE